MKRYITLLTLEFIFSLIFLMFVIINNKDKYFIIEEIYFILAICFSFLYIINSIFDIYKNIKIRYYFLSLIFPIILTFFVYIIDKSRNFGGNPDSSYMFIIIGLDYIKLVILIIGLLLIFILKIIKKITSRNCG